MLQFPRNSLLFNRLTANWPNGFWKHDRIDKITSYVQHILPNKSTSKPSKISNIQNPASRLRFEGKAFWASSCDAFGVAIDHGCHLD